MGIVAQRPRDEVDREANRLGFTELSKVQARDLIRAAIAEMSGGTGIIPITAKGVHAAFAEIAAHAIVLMGRRPPETWDPKTPETVRFYVVEMKTEWLLSRFDDSAFQREVEKLTGEKL